MPFIPVLFLFLDQYFCLILFSQYSLLVNFLPKGCTTLSGHIVKYEWELLNCIKVFGCDKITA